MQHIKNLVGLNIGFSSDGFAVQCIVSLRKWVNTILQLSVLYERKIFLIFFLLTFHIGPSFAFSKVNALHESACDRFCHGSVASQCIILIRRFQISWGSVSVKEGGGVSVK